jgi:steroid delta-isomerase-like uncharacterized protein
MTEVKDTAARFVAAFNAHDERALLALHAADIKFEAPDYKANNATEATAYATRWLNGFPNGTMTVQSEIVNAPWIVQEIVMEGTHTAPLVSAAGTVPPTHKKVVGKAVHFLRIDNGKIAEARIYFDQYDMMSQLGLIPAPATV